MDNIVFREAEIDDAEEMISYLNIVGRESDNLMHGSNGFNVPIEAIKHRIQASYDADNSVIMIALAGKEIIARAELAGYPGPRLHHNAKLSISVRKDYWNKKIGTSLMTEIIGCARKMNLLNIELEVVADNKAAIALYHKMGFSDVGVYKNYWFANNVYSDAIVMQKCFLFSMKRKRLLLLLTSFIVICICAMALADSNKLTEDEASEKMFTLTEDEAAHIAAETIRQQTGVDVPLEDKTKYRYVAWKYTKGHPAWRVIFISETEEWGRCSAAVNDTTHLSSGTIQTSMISHLLMAFCRSSFLWISLSGNPL